MSNEDLVNKIERSLHMLIDNSTAAGRLEVRDDLRGICEPDYMILNAFRSNVTLHRRIIMNTVKQLIDNGEDNGSKKEASDDEAPV